MAEPIRKVAPPAHRRPLHGARPHPRPRPVLWVPDERDTPPSPPSPASSVPTGPETLAERPRTPSPAPVSEKRLRAFLLTALGLDLGALLLPVLLPSEIAAPSPSDILLATVVLLAGSAVLAIGTVGRRSG